MAFCKEHKQCTQGKKEIILVLTLHHLKRGLNEITEQIEP